MSKYQIPAEILEKYQVLKHQIKERLFEFSQIKPENYFYELCYCILTPQTSAINAEKAVIRLEKAKFQTKKFDPTEILNDKSQYIRFHITKAKRLIEMKEKFDDTYKILTSNMKAELKREWLVDNIKGIGMKEASHFLRNIGNTGLAILDRHILKHLVLCNIYKDLPKVSTKKDYLAVEKKFKEFAKKVQIPMDELDLLFWSYETGKILK
ncbi:MAG: N-glycosylase/DNA lyase [Candidatus Kapabacteria bacterium]|nr:N-glycosylase/DNA lyase [Candidatus Kapabacteria bacterium]